jgi:hypothetical protein
MVLLWLNRWKKEHDGFATGYVRANSRWLSVTQLMWIGCPTEQTALGYTADHNCKLLNRFKYSLCIRAFKKWGYSFGHFEVFRLFSKKTFKYDF